jgi:hypothetical protein
MFTEQVCKAAVVAEACKSIVDKANQKYRYYTSQTQNQAPINFAEK